MKFLFLTKHKDVRSSNRSILRRSSYYKSVRSGSFSQVHRVPHGCREQCHPTEHRLEQVGTKVCGRLSCLVDWTRRFVYSARQRGSTELSQDETLEFVGLCFQQLTWMGKHSGQKRKTDTVLWIWFSDVSEQHAHTLLWKNGLLPCDSQQQRFEPFLTNLWTKGEESLPTIRHNSGRNNMYRHPTFKTSLQQGNKFHVCTHVSLTHTYFGHTHHDHHHHHRRRHRHDHHDHHHTNNNNNSNNNNNNKTVAWRPMQHSSGWRMTKESRSVFLRTWRNGTVWGKLRPPTLVWCPFPRLLLRRRRDSKSATKILGF